MIRPREISQFAIKEGVRQQQVEKDYIISWILWGVYQNALLRKGLIFKGGTCIKKIYIEDYRYSEDLDFTLHPDWEKKLLNDEIYAAFNEVFVIIKETANIILSIPEDSKEVHETGGLKFYIEYIGPLGGRGDHTKIDISKGEKLEFDLKWLKLLNRYSDIKEENVVTIQCYCLEEIVIEKMAALMGRSVPRDLYDFEYLTNTIGIELQDIFNEFQNKARHKGHNPADFIQRVNQKEHTLEKAWTLNLNHQVKNLRKFKDVWRDFQKQLRKIEKCK